IKEGYFITLHFFSLNILKSGRFEKPTSFPDAPVLKYVFFRVSSFDTSIFLPFLYAPLPLYAQYIFFITGSLISPSIGNPVDWSTNAIEKTKIGNPQEKAIVPSIGSQTQIYFEFSFISLFSSP